MRKSRSNAPIISLNLDKEFTKNSNKLLLELLEIFIEETPELQGKINKAFYAKQKVILNELLHKFYGSCVYCGFERLKNSLIDFKEAIKKANYSKKYLDDFNKEIENALKEAIAVTKYNKAILQNKLNRFNDE